MIPAASHVKRGGPRPSSAVAPSAAVGVGDRELFVQPLRAEVERGSRVRHRRSPGAEREVSFWDDASLTFDEKCVALSNVGEETMSGKDGTTMDG